MITTSYEDLRKNSSQISRSDQLIYDHMINDKAGDQTETRTKLLELIERENTYRRAALSLQASENFVSSNVRKALSSDLASRYSHVETSGHNSYGGASASQEILGITEDLAKKVYKAGYAEVRPTGGHIAALASILAVCSRGDTMMAISPASGGYPGYSQEYIPDMLALKSVNIPFIDETQEIDYENCEARLKDLKPSAIVLGQSAFVKPYDLKRIREMVDDNSPETAIIYDGSHVMGLIAGGAFQAEALTYADILLGSTHKSFFGPQGGIILTKDGKLMEEVRKQLIWKTMDNYHPNRVAALAVALSEMEETGKEYASLVVNNSKSLAKELDKGGIGVLFAPWYSYSHQILLDRKWFSSTGQTALSFSEKMEQNGIILDRDGRIGTSEISHLGLTDMHRIAELFTMASAGNSVKNLVEDMVMHAPGVRKWLN